MMHATDAKRGQLIDHTHMSSEPDDATVIAASVARPQEFTVIFERHFDEIHRYLRRRHRAKRRSSPPRCSRSPSTCGLATGHWLTVRVPGFTGSRRPRFHVGAPGRGYCWEASLASTAPDAYRCFQGNLIHDPCFAASPHATSVVCFLDPWHAVTVLHLTRRLPKPSAPPKGPPLPWAIVTTDGRHCVFMTGATALVGGERVNYGCTDRTYLLGNPDTRQPLWTIRSDRHLSLTQMHAPLPLPGGGDQADDRLATANAQTSGRARASNCLARAAEAAAVSAPSTTSVK